jgi:formamidopyrimidine-DNA glycosylase
MSGRLGVVPEGAPQDPHERVALRLAGGERLAFVDPRKFGRFVRVDDPARALAGLGPEPLDPAFGPEHLLAALLERRRLLKPLLLDQAFLAGLGNIYTDEALHRAGLHPLRRSDRVRAAEAHRLHGAIVRILAEAIRREGSSIDASYRTPDGRPGGFQGRLRVYGREGEPCRTCGTPIRRIVVAQRGTHLCPVCQPRRRRPRGP